MKYAVPRGIGKEAIIMTAESIQTEHSPTLIIGLGGTGFKTLQRIKIQLSHSKMYTDQGVVPVETPEVVRHNGGEIALLGIDTQPYMTDLHVPLVRGEYMPLAIGCNIDVWIESQCKKDNANGIREHWYHYPDGKPYTTGIGNVSIGAAQNRVVGRAAVFIEAAKLYDRFVKIIAEFYDAAKSKIPDNAPLQVHVVGSLAGGTGSGMIFDIPYLVRLAAQQVDVRISPSLIAHFALGGCFQGIINATIGYDANDDIFPGGPPLPGPGPKASLQSKQTQANTYVALKELDHWYYKFATATGEPIWKVNYASVIGTELDASRPSAVSRERPYDLMYLYDNRNCNALVLSGPELTYDIIAQFIYCQTTSGLSSGLVTDLVNVRSLGEVTPNGKVQAYSAAGIATSGGPDSDLSVPSLDLHELDESKEEELRKNMYRLHQIAGEWLSSRDEHEQIRAAKFRHLLCPDNTAEVVELWEKYEDRCDFRGSGTTNKINVSRDFIQGLTLISTSHGYTLDSLPFLPSYKNCEEALLAVDRNMETPSRRTIFKDYEDYHDPLEPYTNE